MQNGLIERFNRGYREAVLDMFIFQDLSQVREQTEKWLRNTTRNDHMSRGAMTPGEYSLCCWHLAF
jgi:putative transposase